jgi:histone acetyltransferase (RNA polymerase elongator complex component)
MRSDQEIVHETIQTYLDALGPNNLPEKREVAFYGGSFTGLTVERQSNLIDAVIPWIKTGHIHSIRVSTHSLLVDDINISFLKDNFVQVVELGIQSTNNDVLSAVGRPCRFATVQDAVKSIRKRNLSLGLQLMPGLPKDDESTFLQSVKDVIDLRPDFVRIYPTLVIRNTTLFEMYSRGEYLPWSLDRMLQLVKAAMIEFEKVDIPVIRVGLHSDPSMLENLVDGPYHPSFRYLVESLIARDKMVSMIERLNNIPPELTFIVPSNKVSLYLGHKKNNIDKIKKLFGINNIFLQQTGNQEDLKLVA